MSDPAIKQRLRRAKARTARELRRGGWDVFTLADANVHFLARKGYRLKAVRVDIILCPNDPIIDLSIRPIGVDVFQVWAFGLNNSAIKKINVK